MTAKEANDNVKDQKFPEDWLKQSLDNISQQIIWETEKGKYSLWYYLKVSNGRIAFSLFDDQIAELIKILQDGFGYKVKFSNPPYLSRDLYSMEILW